ncbi:phasin family protein [Halomonas sp. TRM85114]|uniref:phasin family protein n=1 Tax=Halomonas jincaotanensis TaxID=2810616 RepID=UPI001BD53CB4|nr:phasin family protein [Halomonas jincaotanensis]MBS9404924.1 phasin family protein [Halomonas jincaotanensis]
MTNAFDTKQITEQFESMFFAPARAYAELSVDYTEKLVNAQLDAGKAYSDTSLAQLRNLMNVKDAEGLCDYMEGQQQVAKDLTERLKGDAEKVVALQQDFAKDSQRLTEENVKQSQKLVEENVEKTQKAAESKAKQATDTSAKTAKSA